VAAQSFLLTGGLPWLVSGDHTNGVLHDTVRSHCYLLDKAVEENALAKILGRPFDDNEVLGLARNVLIAIKQLPDESRNKFDEKWDYALAVITVFKPEPKSYYTTNGKGNKNFVLF
jgi:hypothetical protein